MARKMQDVEELDFDSIHLEPDPDHYDPLERSNYGDRGYRWQDDPRRYDPEQPKRKRKKRK